MREGIQYLVLRSRIPTLNEHLRLERSHRQQGARRKREVEQALVLEMRAQGLHPVQDYPVYICYAWHRPDRRTDMSNIAWGVKYIEDALQRAGVLRNDGWNEIRGFEHDFVHNPSLTSPHVEVTLWEEGTTG